MRQHLEADAMWKSHLRSDLWPRLGPTGVPFVSAVERFSVTRLHGRGLQEVKVWESSVPRLPAGGCRSMSSQRQQAS